MFLEKREQALAVFLLTKGGDVKSFGDPERLGFAGRFEQRDAVTGRHYVIGFAADDEQRQW